MKLLVLRFDIDTFRCIKEGVPNLLDLAREEQVRFTFFCNMGRAISRPALFRKLLLQHRPSAHGMRSEAKLSASVKLGYSQILGTILMNPMVGMSHPQTLRRVRHEGHEVGLHGGRNHGAWQHEFRGWDASRIRREVSAGKFMFEQAVGTPPRLFSSPGWQGSGALNSILKDMGFKASADRHGADERTIECNDGFCTLPTNLLAEPGGVAYFESFAARGEGNGEVVERFREALEDGRRLYVLYDHPCFAGTRALETVRAVIRCAAESGVEITTFSDLMRQQSSQ